MRFNVMRTARGLNKVRHAVKGIFSPKGSAQGPQTKEPPQPKTLKTEKPPATPKPKKDTVLRAKTRSNQSVMKMRMKAKVHQENNTRQERKAIGASSYQKFVAKKRS